MSKYEFMHSTLTDIHKRIEVYKESKEEEHKKLEYLAWRIGTYTIPAVGFVMDTKHRVKYPKNPIIDEEVVVEDMELTDEQKEEWTNKWIDRLSIMTNKNLQGG